MGTRSLTRFFQDDKEIACVYQQFDGYPDGVGKGLAEFLKSGTLVNGIPGGRDDQKFFNGMGCLAAQYIAENKQEAGGLYLYAPGSNDCGEAYTYEVHCGFEGEGWDRKPTGLTVKCFPKYGRKDFSGTVEEFAAWCVAPEEEEAA